MSYTPRLIISLTTWHKRISTVHLALQTLINQSKKADMIILCLNKEELDNAQVVIPSELTKLVNSGLVTLLWAENLKSYKKLVPTLLQYPDDIIVTADDDILYPINWLELLYTSYLKYPKAIHCHRAFRFIFNKRFVFPPNRISFSERGVKTPFNTYFTGCGGVLYPPHSLCKDVCNSDIFMKIASENDDYWFWAMSVLNKTRTIVVENNISEIVEIDGTDDSSLYLTGNFQGNNNIQLKNIFDYYPHIKRILYWDTRWYKYKAFFITKLL